MRFSRSVVLVTGASSGIGRALAESFAREGARLVLVARRSERLEALARELGGKERALALTADVTDEASMQEAVATALETFGRLDVVVANAGFSVKGKVGRLSLDDYRRQFETNVFGVMRTLDATLAALKASKGRFVVMGSVMSHVSLPGYTPYSMSKFAARAFAEGAWAELRPHGISVTHVSPGYVTTEIWKVDNRGTFDATRHDTLPKWFPLAPETAAKRIVNAVEARKRQVSVAGHAALLIAINNLFPGLLLRLTAFLTEVRKRRLPGHAP
jgi:NADP-dependent 3-hydroxy acid dehydrogenase YdfG